MKKVKTVTIEELYPLAEALETSDQIKLKEFLEKTLQTKADKAKGELDLISGTQKPA